MYAQQNLSGRNRKHFAHAQSPLFLPHTLHNRGFQSPSLPGRLRRFQIEDSPKWEVATGRREKKKSKSPWAWTKRFPAASHEEARLCPPASSPSYSCPHRDRPVRASNRPHMATFLAESKARGDHAAAAAAALTWTDPWRAHAWTFSSLLQRGCGMFRARAAPPLSAFLKKRKKRARLCASAWKIAGGVVCLRRPRSNSWVGGNSCSMLTRDPWALLAERQWRMGIPRWVHISIFKE